MTEEVSSWRLSVQMMVWFAATISALMGDISKGWLYNQYKSNNSAKQKQVAANTFLNEDASVIRVLGVLIDALPCFHRTI